MEGVYRILSVLKYGQWEWSSVDKNVDHRLRQAQTCLGQVCDPCDRSVTHGCSKSCFPSNNHQTCLSTFALYPGLPPALPPPLPLPPTLLPHHLRLG